MRFAISGITYDSSEAKPMAAAGWAETGPGSGQATRFDYTLFEIPNGTFFLHICIETAEQDAAGRWHEFVEEDVIPLTSDGGTHDVVTVLDDLFDDPAATLRRLA
jgi:hypothetical protein